MPILYGSALSTFTRKARIALGEKKISYELKFIGMGRHSAPLVALNPLGRVPVYHDGEIVIPDSSVIVAYLERTVPEPPLYPATPADFARALFLEEYADTRLREASGPYFFQRVVRRILQKQPPDERALEGVSAVRDECYGFLEKQRGERPDEEFLAGSAFSVADLAVAAQLATLEQAGEAPDPDTWPRLAAWFEAQKRRPVLSGLLREEGALLAAGKLG